MRDIKARLLTESGRESKQMIPPRTTAIVPIQETVGVDVYSHPDLIRKCIFAINYAYGNTTQLVLYNGGLEPQWIQHGDNIAQVR